STLDVSYRAGYEPDSVVTDVLCTGPHPSTGRRVRNKRNDPQRSTPWTTRRGMWTVPGSVHTDSGGSSGPQSPPGLIHTLSTLWINICVGRGEAAGTGEKRRIEVQEQGRLCATSFPHGG